IAARFEIVDVTTDPLREGVDVRGSREPALASGNPVLGRVNLQKRLEHEPDDARHERVDNRTRIGGEGPHDVVAPAEEDLVDALLRPSALCRALNSTRAHGFPDRVAHLPGDRLAGLAHSDGSRRLSFRRHASPPKTASVVPTRASVVGSGTAAVDTIV